MAIEVKFGKVSSPKIKVNKTMTVTATVNCTLIEPTDVSAPVLRVDAAQITNGKAVLLAANYVQISDFGRYYFIIDRVAETTNDWLIYLAVDVLKSYSSTVTGYTGHIARSQSDGSWMLPDGLVPMDENAQYNVISYSPFNPLPWNSLSSSSWCYTLSVAGTLNSQGHHTGLDYPSDNLINRIYVANEGALRELAKVIAGGGTWHTKWFQDTDSGVFSLNAFPFDVPHRSTDLLLMIGEDTPEIPEGNIHVRELSSYHRESTLRSSDAGIRMIELPTDFRKYTTSIDIFLPFVGWKSLDARIFAVRPYIDIKYDVNLMTGAGVCTVYALPSSSASSSILNIIGTYEFMASIQLPLTISNAAEISRSTVQSVISSMASIGLGAAVGGWAGAGVAAVGAATNVAFTSTRPTSFSSSGTLSGNANVLLPTTPIVAVSYSKSPILDSSTQMSRFAAKHGIRFDEVHALSTVSGFTVVDNPEPDMPEGITEGEYGELKGLMSSGIII